MKETLQISGNNIVSSSLGWTLELLSVRALQYAEPDRTLLLEIEDCPTVTGELEWIISTPENWVWKVADGNEPVAEEKIPEILNRVSLAFWKLDMPIKEIV